MRSGDAGPRVFDALLPAEMAAKAELLGIQKTRLEPLSLFALAVLAGAFISFGGLVSIVVGVGSEGAMPYGMARLLSGVVFTVGLILVVVGGAELFTGNVLMVMAWANGRVRALEVARAWLVVLVGNAVGAIGTAVLVFLADTHLNAGGSVGSAALVVAEAKARLEFFPAFVRGLLCNVLVCLAIWLSYSARTTADRILSIVPPIATFVAAGFEHSVANMFFLPYALLVKHAGALDGAADLGALTIGGVLGNLLPVTLGNVVGGAGLVGGVYWFIYLRRRPSGG
jgi:formate/nitrite transporter